jgi:UPF0755 protein
VPISSDRRFFESNPDRWHRVCPSHPAESKLLYFVSRNDGTHEFSETYSKHVAAVDRYQRRKAPR